MSPTYPDPTSFWYAHPGMIPGMVIQVLALIFWPILCGETCHRIARGKGFGHRASF